MRVETARGRIVVFQYKKRLWWALFIDAIFCIEMCGYPENLSLWRRNSCINTRALYAVVTNPIARKGQGRNSLAGSRGSAPWVIPATHPPATAASRQHPSATRIPARRGSGWRRFRRKRPAPEESSSACVPNFRARDRSCTTDTTACPGSRRHASMSRNSSCWKRKSKWLPGSSSSSTSGS